MLKKTDWCPCCKKGKIACPPSGGKLLLGIVGCRDLPRNHNVIFWPMPSDQQIEDSFKANEEEKEI